MIPINNTKDNGKRLSSAECIIQCKGKVQVRRKRLHERGGVRWDHKGRVEFA